MPGSKNTMKFYDAIQFNSDEFPVSSNNMLIGEIYFRIATDIIKHERVIFGISDWLGSIGGIELFLLQTCSLIFKEYLTFGFIINTEEFLE